MREFGQLIARDMRLALRQGGGVGTALGFFVMVVALLPLGLGPDLNLLSRIAPGVLWVALLLAALLSMGRIFQDDFDDGSLDLMALGPLPLELVVIAKSLAHWLTTGLPLVVVAPVLGLLLNLDAAGYGALVITMLAGTPAISFLGSVGAAITVGLRRGGLLLSLLILPLYVPVIVFGVGAVNAVIVGPSSFGPPFLILTALSLASLVLAPLAAAAALRMHLS